MRKIVIQIKQKAATFLKKLMGLLTAAKRERFQAEIWQEKRAGSFRRGGYRRERAWRI